MGSSNPVTAVTKRGIYRGEFPERRGGKVRHIIVLCDRAERMLVFATSDTFRRNGVASDQPVNEREFARLCPSTGTIVEYIVPVENSISAQKAIAWASAQS